MSNDMSILEFWNSRAKLGEKAGSNDLQLKKLEIREISKHIKDGMQIAEFGCGNGITATYLADRFDVTIDAFDFSPEMISECKRVASERGLSSKVTFCVADINNPPNIDKRYDCVYAERMIINLENWDSQRRAIHFLAGCLKMGGRLLLLENSKNGLGEINSMRRAVGLSDIASPWHNVYLDDDVVEAEEVPGCRFVGVVPFSSTYYLFSRVVNASLAKGEGREPAYDAPVNLLAQMLPAIGTQAQTKLWIWERVGT